MFSLTGRSTPRACALALAIALCGLLLPQVAGGATQGAVTNGPVVDQAATPAGWLPVDFGNAQISVPSSWSLITDGAASCGTASGVIILGQGSWCPPGMGESAASGTSIVTLSTNQSLSGDRGRPSTVVNGIPIYAPSIAPVYWAPSLSARLSFSGPQQPSVLASLTASPRAVVLAQARTATTPSAWRWIAFEGIRFAVPATWALARSTHAPPCGTDIVLPVAGVTLAREPALPLPCPLPEAEVRAVPQVGGVEVDGFKPSSLESTTCVGPRTIGSLHVCISPAPGYGVLVVQLSALGMTPMTVKIGMTGNGTVARSILHSLRRSST